MKKQTEKQMETFTENQELSADSFSNWDCVFTKKTIKNCYYIGKVIKVTAKTVTVDVRGYGTRRCKIHNTGDGDFIFPLGRYEMAPIFHCRKSDFDSTIFDLSTSS